MRRLLTVFALVSYACLAAGGAQTAPASIKVSTDEETATARRILIGSWYGEKQHEDGPLQRWLVKRAADGTYLIQVVVTDGKGLTEEWGEVGVWGIRPPVYFTATRGLLGSEGVFAADVADPRLYDAYQVRELTEHSFTYDSHASGKTFTVKKVADDFRLNPAKETKISSAKPTI